MLQWLPQVARDSGVAKEHWEEVNTAANELRTSFEKVHQNIDNKQDPNFGSVAQEIDQKIARLQEIAQAPVGTGGKRLSFGQAADQAGGTLWSRFRKET